MADQQAQISNAIKAINKRNTNETQSFTYTLDSGEVYNTKDRAIEDVKPPATFHPQDDEVFLPSGLPNCEFLKTHFFNEGRLRQHQAIRILHEATKLLSSEPNLLEVPAPITVCGDIHGQYYDLIKLFEVGGDPSTTSYLFLGDYVDRGSFSIECLLYLYSLKLTYPDKVFMLRGNHECKHLTEYFTFKNECLHKYNEELYEKSLASFNALPLAAIMNKQFFCVHGGLSPELKSLNDLVKLNRFREPPTKGLMCDLLWADPIEDYDDDNIDQTFMKNSVRGCSYAFTYKASCQFLERTGLLSIIRAHEAQDAGYRMYKRTKTMGFPSLLTMFSAPNYLDNYNNKAAILKYENNVMNIRQFNASPHPYWLPHFMDVFTWSLPFVGEKITDMLVSILNVCTEEELSEEKDDNFSYEVSQPSSPVDMRAPASLSDHVEEDTYEARKQALRNKVIAIGRVSRMYQILRQETDDVARLKELNDGQLPKGSLLNGPQGLKSAINNFEDAKKADRANEKLPPTKEEQLRQESERQQQIKREINNNSSPVFQNLIRKLSH
ncbi:serine/threonine-protein phosphatase 2B catalytic subunit A1 [[Candida] jaroonii]|uniref:Serine/threonine-protein phosphatase 2B catalytic subunit A1 n=1 Tax=[Candida] jaroonii TaxID=467808 RepID=A0ACA9YE21_9ASCO|nr:serine/threonine-protein phosphatase 2B catalytic subunit A1 [[Candida] jaroonii]